MPALLTRRSRPPCASSAAAASCSGAPGCAKVDGDLADVHTGRAAGFGNALEVVMGAERESTPPLGEGAGDVGAEAAGGACEQGECPGQFEHHGLYRGAWGGASGGTVAPWRAPKPTRAAKP